MQEGQFDNILFRELTPIEVKQFREYARNNDPPNLEDWELYHPVCRDEWEKRGIKFPPSNTQKSLNLGQ